jgi:hypothetical protein
MVLLTILKWVTVRTYAVYRNLLPPAEAEKETLKDITVKAGAIIKVTIEVEDN